MCVYVSVCECVGACACAYYSMRMSAHVRVHMHMCFMSDLVDEPALARPGAIS